MVFELKELGSLVGREISPSEFLALPGGPAGPCADPARLVAEIGCCEQSRESTARIGIRNRTGAHEWGSFKPLPWSSNGEPGRSSQSAIAIMTHAPCAYVQRWLASRPTGEFEELDGLVRFDGLDRRAVLRELVKGAPGYRDLKGAMVLARCQARSAALEAETLEVREVADLLVSFGVGLAHDRVLFGGAYFLGVDAGTRFLGLGDDPSNYQVELKDGELVLEDGCDLVVRAARDHRAQIQGLLASFDRFEPQNDPRVGPTDTAAGLKICLRIHSQEAPVQAVMRLLGTGFLDIRQMIWFSSGELTSAKVRRARELLRGFETHLDRLDAGGLETIARALI